MTPIRVVHALLAAALLVLAPGCATRFNSYAHFDTTYDFSKVDSFALAPQRAERAATKNGKLLAAAIQSELAQRGYREVAQAEAGVLISYEVGVQAPARLSGGNRLESVEGGITVSILDPATRNTVWYGWSEKTLSPDDTPEVAIPEAVDALFSGRIPNAPQ